DAARSKGRAGRAHPRCAGHAERKAANGRGPQQVRGHELRRDRRGDGADHQGGQVAVEPGTDEPADGAERLRVHGRRGDPRTRRGRRRPTMSKRRPLSEDERADLVAYLDGETTGDAKRAIEAKLNLDPVWRAEAASLKRTWNLLDYLPRPD